MATLGIGLIGSGFMGRCHALAFRAAAGVFALPTRPVLEMLADIDDDAARRAAEGFGFARSTGDWRVLVDDPAVDVVDVTAPNTLHEPIAMAAIAAGKTVYCEKPLAPDSATAKAMVDAAEAAGVATMVGFNYLKNPMVMVAREIIDSGDIGEVIRFRGIHAEDYMADANAPYTWRLDPVGGHGVIADLGSHIISLARYLVGDIAAVSGDLETVVKRRPGAPGAGETRAVEVDDQARALLRFAGGARGSIEASWMAAGRKMQLAFEVTGTRGSIALNHERLNELELYQQGQPAGRGGFKTIVAGPEHPHYSSFCVAPGHQLGFNDLKTIEVRDLIDGLAGGTPPWPDFREAWEIQRVVDAVVRSARESRWVAVEEIG
ncbi:MAG: Gfo/Idh/MocA family oxidoreductase [Alphaproteobacteria bacterium]